MLLCLISYLPLFIDYGSIQGNVLLGYSNELEQVVSAITVCRFHSPPIALENAVEELVIIVIPSLLPVSKLSHKSSQ